MHNGTPHADDGLRIERDTEPEDVREFVERRVKRPLEFPDAGVVVWNFSTHEPAEDQLRRKAERLQKSAYVIPYQVPGAWGYMQDLLPRVVRNAELLVYSNEDGRYKAFPNFRRLSHEQEDGAEMDQRQRIDLDYWIADHVEVGRGE